MLQGKTKTLIAAVILLCITAMSLSAQQQLSEADSITFLNKEIKKLRADTASLNKQIWKLQQRIDKNHINTLEKERFNAIAAADSALTRSCRDSLYADSLQREMDRLEAFKIEFVKELNKDVSDYIMLGYDTMKIDSLDRIIESLRPFVGISDELRGLSERVVDARHRKAGYDRLYKKLSDEPYSRQAHSEFTVLAEDLKQNSSTAQVTNVDSLLSALVLYPDALKHFLSLTKDIQIQLEFPRIDKKLDDARTYSKLTFEMDGDTYERDYTALYSHIPYLNKLYLEYKGLLLGDNPLDVRVIEIEEIIKKMSDESKQ